MPRTVELCPSGPGLLIAVGLTVACSAKPEANEVDASGGIDPTAVGEGDDATEAGSGGEAGITLDSLDGDEGEAAGDSGDDGSEGEADDGSDVDTPRFDLVVPDADGDIGPLDCQVLRATIRDFSQSHEDFQRYTGNAATKGIVEMDLGADELPVYTGTARGTQITSPESFAQWYVDVPGTNHRFEHDIELLRSPGGDACVYDSSAFFPIDGQGFGNEGSVDSTGMSRNFHFTSTTFTYRAGQRFTFTGDDDLWMFVHGRLAIDLGGLHPALSDTIELDTLGLTPGMDYTMHIFHAERRTNHSNFRIETNITFDPPG